MSVPFVHKIIIAGCRRLPRPLPSRHHQDTLMDPHQHPTRPSTPLLAAAVALALLLAAAAWTLTARSGDPTAAGPPPPAPSAAPTTTPAAATTTTLDAEAEVIARLRHILRVREQAFAARDASPLNQVYASDCPCLAAGRDAIAALRRARVVWKGRSISLRVQSTQEVNDRLWEVVALFSSKPFRIETEQGSLVREQPAERIRYRFLLVRVTPGEPWLLGNASVVRGA
jgi:hypothetical protein